MMVACERCGARFWSEDGTCPKCARFSMAGVSRDGTVRIDGVFAPSPTGSGRDAPRPTCGTCPYWERARVGGECRIAPPADEFPVTSESHWCAEHPDFFHRRDANHEDRIYRLEQQVTDLLRVVAAPKVVMGRHGDDVV